MGDVETQQRNARHIRVWHAVLKTYYCGKMRRRTNIDTITATNTKPKTINITNTMIGTKTKTMKMPKTNVDTKT